MMPVVDLALLLFGAKLGGIVFKKLKQPSVVGELIAGIVLGPSLLALVSPSSLVSMVSDLGLLFLILLVSLSIEWKILEGRAEKYVWIEVTRLIITLAFVYVITSILAWNIYTFFIIGIVVVLSSTAIVARSLADMKQLNTPEGQALLGLEVVDEVVAIICVALLANMMAGEALTIGPVLTTIFVVVGFFVVMGRVGFKFVNRITGSIQKYGIEESLLGFTLLLAFVLGSLTESLKLASILGVFIAGMILSRSAQYPIITRKVKDIGESFFIPMFFASVGLTINLFAAAEYIYLALGLTVAIIAIKMASALITLKFFNYSIGQSLKIGSGFVTLSEMTIVIAALAMAKISPPIYISLIVSFIIVSAVSPLIMSLTFGNKFNSMDLKLWMTMRKKSKWNGKAHNSRHKRNKYVYNYKT
jgi:Kef-type K+ transport system membrane component KefB